MTQTLILVVLFVAAMAMLPWLVRRLQQRQAGGMAASGASSRVLSAVAVGPHQRVVTVEVGPDHARTVLVLGVTAQQVSCLHVFGPAAASPRPAVPGFAVAMEKAVAAPGAAVPSGGDHGG
jgi:flagellar protein FliO/FliZ